MRVVDGQAIARARLAALIIEFGKQRGVEYQIAWGEPSTRTRTETLHGAASFALPTLAGGEFDLGEVLGRKPIVLVFWASWCQPCIEEAPHLVRLESRYGEGVEFVSVSIDSAEDHDALRRVVAKLGLTYPVLLDAEGVALAKFSSGASIPLTLVIDREGNIIHRLGNFRRGDESRLTRAIESALSSSSASPGDSPTDAQEASQMPRPRNGLEIE